MRVMMVMMALFTNVQTKKKKKSMITNIKILF